MTARVLQVTPSYPPVVGGIENHVANLVERLADHGYEPVVLTPDRAGVGTEPGVYRARPALRVYKSVLAPGIVYRLFSLEYDLLHMHAPFHFGLEFATVASRVRGVPMVVTTHMYGGRDALVSRTYDRVIYDRCLDSADAVIPTTWEYVSDVPWFQRNDEKCRPIPLGVDVDHYAPVPDAREQLGYGADERIVLFVGSMESLHDYKNVDLLIEAFAHSDVADRLVLVGEGDNRDTYRAAAREEGIADRVEFPGYVPEADLPAYYSAADVFVLASDQVESFGIVLLEAMACGTPVVATDIRGVRDVVDDAGTVVQPGSSRALTEGIETVLTNSASFDVREYVVNQYAQPTVISRIAGIYDELLA